jgi:hypothetical protein
MSGKTEQLAMHKNLLRLQLAAHRMELEADIATLRDPLRKAAIGGSVLHLLRSHPIFVTAAGALISRVPRLGLTAKLVAACVAGWEAVRLFRAWRRD